MPEPTTEAVGEIARRLGGITAGCMSEKAIYGLLVGALYGLRRASELGFTDRSGELLPPGYGQELARVAGELASSSDVADHAWLAGFYFNSSLQRLAAVCERLGEHAGKRQDLIPEVRREVNRIKHEVDGLLGGRNVTAAQALDAASILVTAVSSVFGEE